MASLPILPPLASVQKMHFKLIQTILNSTNTTINGLVASECIQEDVEVAAHEEF